jgi:hypothetical protein
MSRFHVNSSHFTSPERRWTFDLAAAAGSGQRLGFPDGCCPRFALFTVAIARERCRNRLSSDLLPVGAERLSRD